MNDHALTLVLRQRRAALDEARRYLAEAVAEEAAHAAREKSIERAIEHETLMAERLDAPDGVVEAFASWLRATRVELAAARELLHTAEGRTHEARAVLAACRAAAAMIETLLSERALVARETDARAEQRSLDQIVR